MAGAIVDILPGERGISLGRDQYLRTFQIGDNWRQLRGGILFTLQTQADTCYYSLIVGVCSGQAGWWDANFHGVGWVIGDVRQLWPYLQLYNYTAGATPYFSSSTNFMRSFARAGGVTTFGATGTSLGHFFPIYPRKNIAGIYLDRSASLSTVQVYSLNNYSVLDGADYTAAQFMTWLETQVPSAYVIGPFPVTYTNPGTPLDTLFVLGGTEIPRLTIFSMGVARVV